MSHADGLLGLDSSLPFSSEPLSHVFIVMHGAGDPYVDHQPWLSSMSSFIHRLEQNYNVVRERLQKSSRRTTNTCDAAVAALFMPVEWHRPAFESWQSEIRIAEPAVGAASRAVRKAVAETVGDVLMMASPFWRASIAKHVANQMKEQISAVKRNRPAFDGKVSIVAHSISALIVTELIANKLVDDIDIDSVVWLGCPISAYAALSPGAEQTALATIRKERDNIRFINVFHPLDPVAYRLEPFLLNGDQVLEKAVKVEAQKRTFWEDVGVFWNEVVYNMWSPLSDNDEEGEGGEGGEGEQLNGNSNEMWPLFGGRRRANGGEKEAEGMWRHSGYVLKEPQGGEGDEGETESGGSEVLLSGRIDFELSDGMSTAPFDVIATWGAIKAHQFYWESVDVAQILLDIAVTSERAVERRT